MNPTLSIAVLLAVLQAAQCQTIRDLSACLLGQSLRVDCHFENKTSNPLTYEFSITRDTRKRVINSNMNIPESTYRSRSNVALHRNLIHLFLSSFTTSDEGVYICELKATNDYTDHQIKNITVIKGQRGGGWVSAPSCAAAPAAPGGTRESRFHPWVARMWSEFAGSQPESRGRTEGPLQACVAADPETHPVGACALALAAPWLYLLRRGRTSACRAALLGLASLSLLHLGRDLPPRSPVAPLYFPPGVRKGWSCVTRSPAPASHSQTRNEAGGLLAQSQGPEVLGETTAPLCQEWQTLEDGTCPGARD
uniref:Thy-1 membrane glycoprotein n=1 Tax=Crocodylus porosus TaxID=8502 RepID=A0A7M4E7K6_CROPO